MKRWLLTFVLLLCIFGVYPYAKADVAGTVKTGTLTDGRLCTWNGSLTAFVCDTTNVPTATALASDPADCVTSTHFAVGITASGAATCEAIADADVPNTITVDLSTLATLADGLSTTGKAAVETYTNKTLNSADNVIHADDTVALATDPANCSAGSAAGGVTAGGVAESCLDPIVSTEIDTSAELAGIVTDEVGTDKLVFNTAPVFVTSIESPLLKTVAANAADNAAGFALANAEELCWEASPAGTDVCLAADASEVVQITGGTFDAGDLSGSVADARLSANVSLLGSEIALTTETSGNYAAGDAEAGAALTGDTATSFFSTGTLEDARLSSNVSLLGQTISFITPAEVVDECTGSQSIRRNAGDSAWECFTPGAGGGNSFETWNAPSGTDPVADSSTDTMVVAVGLGLTLTGDSTADSLTWAFDYTQTLAGNPALGAGEGVFSDDCIAGGFLFEGSTGGNTNEYLFCSPLADPVDTTNYFSLGASDGDALAGDSATSFFDAGTLEDARLPSTMANKVFTGSTLVTFNARQGVPPEANFATLDTRNNHPVLDFDASTNETTYFEFIMPQSYGTAGTTVFIQYAMTSATSGDIDWDVDWEGISDSVQDIDSDGFTASVNSVDNTTVPGTSGHVDIVSIAFSDGADMDSCSAGEFCRISVTRDAASDTGTGDAELVGVEIRSQ